MYKQEFEPPWKPRMNGNHDRSAFDRLPVSVELLQIGVEGYSEGNDQVICDFLELSQTYMKAIHHVSKTKKYIVDFRKDDVKQQRINPSLLKLLKSSPKRESIIISVVSDCLAH